MATLLDLKKRLLNVIDDLEEAGSSPLAGKQYKAALLTESIQAGLEAILPWVSKSVVMDLIGNQTAIRYALPADLYRIEAIWEGASRQFMTPTHLAPGCHWADPLAMQSYIDAPQGFVTFSAPLNSSGAKLHYSARWNIPVLDADIIEAPVISHVGIVLFAASYCLLPKSTSAANLGQYKTRVDAGTPIQNPMVEMSSYFMKRFENEMNRHPSRVRGQQ